MKKESWVKKIYTRNGIVRDNTLFGIKVLDIGCGQHKFPESVGMDVVKESEADIVHNVENTPWPIEDNSYDIVFTNHFLEHVDNQLGFFGEVSRILKPGGRLLVQVPYFRSIDAYTDITHKRFFTSRTLDYFLIESKRSGYHYSKSLFTKIGFWYGWPSRSRNPLVRFFKWFIMRHPKFYDQYLSLLLPVPCLTWELEVTK
ncbi:MAG: class I SAM-dependent methyltransferase [Patescibacteria group bacterium]